MCIRDRKILALLALQLEIQQDHINRRLRQHLQRLLLLAAMTHHREIRLGAQQPAQPLAEQKMIVHQQYAYFIHPAPNEKILRRASPLRQAVALKDIAQR